MINEEDTYSSSSSFVLDLEEIPLRMRGRTEMWELKHKHILSEEVIAEGGNGVINNAKWRGLKCVVKCLKHNNNNVEYQDLLNEISIISHLRHPNLVLFLGACTICDPLLILYEYMPNGSLDTYYNKMSIEKNKMWIPENKYINRWIFELSQAICFLHNCYSPIMHRDIKPANILLNDGLHIKLADFGLSRTIKKKNDKYKMSGCTGTMRYMAPEMIFNNGEDYDLKIDIYSLALNLWFICTGTIPFKGLNENPNIIFLIKYGYRPDIKKVKNIKLQELIIQMWDINPENRPSIDIVLNIIEIIVKEERIENKNKCVIL
jgi:serine/threonine protein kinase